MKVKVNYVFDDQEFDENYNILADNRNLIESGKDTVCLSFTDRTPERRPYNESLNSMIFNTTNIKDNKYSKIR